MTTWKKGGQVGPEPRKPTKADKHNGLLFMRDKEMDPNIRTAWRKANGRELSEDEELLGSKLGKRVKAYFAKLVDLVVVGEF